MTRQVVLAGALLICSRAGAADVTASSVYRGLEEPGRYGVANLFDGDGETSYCGEAARVTVALSDADAAVLANMTGVRVTPSRTFPAARLDVTFHYRDANGATFVKAEGALGTEPTTLTFAPSKEPRRGGVQLDVRIGGGEPGNDRRPLCVAELALMGPPGALTLPSLAPTLAALAARDAQLAPLTKDRGAFVRAYLTAFEWVLLNLDKETSDWESARYVFRADGTYESNTAHFVGGGRRAKGRWSVDKNGRVELDGRRRKLAPCSHRRGYLCFSDWFFPSAAW